MTSEPQKLDSLIENSKPKWGGKRDGAGRRHGAANKTTLEKAIVKKAFTDRVNRHADELFNAQFTKAVGTQILFVIHTDSKGNRRKPEMVTDTNTITRFLDENEGLDGTMDNGYAKDSKANDYYFITTSMPDNQAIESMLNRSFGKATEKMEIEASLDANINATIANSETVAQFTNFIKESTKSE